MIVKGGQPCNFNYAAFDRTANLFVAALIYDVTTGSPVLVGSIIPMPSEGNGAYVGSFTPTGGHFYLVIKAVYTDGTYSTPSPDWPPSAEQYDSPTSDTTLLNFNYGAYDENTHLTINATIYDLTDSTQASIVMAHVALGVYFGQYHGALNKSYSVLKVPTDFTRAPGLDSFQTFTISGGGTSTDPGIQNVVQGVEYEINGVPLVGTLVIDNPRIRLRLAARVTNSETIGSTRNNVRLAGAVSDEVSSKKGISGRISVSNDLSRRLVAGRVSQFNNLAGYVGVIL